MYEFSILDHRAAPWERIESCVDHVVFKSRTWIDFLTETQGITPLVVAVGKDGRTIGWFIGGTMRKGIRIVASPFEGWSTPFQGLSVLEPISTRERLLIYEELIPFCYAKTGCWFFQTTDWSLKPEDLDGSPLTCQAVKGYRLDLSRDEAALFAGFDSATRRAIRKAQKGGVTVQEPTDLDQFITDYYDQLQDVFGKQGLKPTYLRSRVEALIKHLHGAGRLLLLESRSAEGKCIGTGIFPAAHQLMQFWGGASYRSHQILRPNEILFWEAIRYWKQRGVLEFEFGGGGAYKEKYGPEPYRRAQIIAPRWPILSRLKTLARAGFTLARTLRITRF